MSWSVQHSKLIYGLLSKDLSFLDYNQNGELLLHLNGKWIPLISIVKRVRKKFRNPDSSFVLQVPELLLERINALKKQMCELQQVKQLNIPWKLVYPVKSSPNIHVLKQIVNLEEYGFEVGTKPELVVVSKILTHSPSKIIICNGVKDLEYYQKALELAKQGHTILFSIENITDFKLIQKVLPHLNNANFLFSIRLKLVWKKSDYREKEYRVSKIGLSEHQLQEVIEFFRSQNHLDRLQMLHAHPGQLISTKEEFSKYFRYVFDWYHRLKTEYGVSLSMIDVGGGINLSSCHNEAAREEVLLEDYPQLVLDAFSKILNKRQPIPTLFLEPGRAIVAVSSLLVVKILESKQLNENPSSKRVQGFTSQIMACTGISEIFKTWRRIELLLTGEGDKFIDEQVLAELETIRLHVRKKLLQLGYTFTAEDTSRYPELFQPTGRMTGNFSVFSSLLDSIILQLTFPVLPMVNGNIQPQGLFVLDDLTCDEDGKLYRYCPVVGYKEQLLTRNFIPLTFERRTLLPGFPFPSFEKVKERYAVIPLIGAYQNVLTTYHNLFGLLPQVVLHSSENTDSIREEYYREETIEQVLKKYFFEVRDDSTTYFKFNMEE